jgi:hypothetical protein
VTLRVTVQHHAADGSDLRRLRPTEADIFSVQDDIAGAVSMR